MLLFTALTQAHSKLSKWSREIQESVQMAKAKNVCTFEAAEKGECSESSYN